MTQLTPLLTGEDLMRFADAMGMSVRDEGLLMSAAIRPAMRLYGKDLYPDLVTKAAVVMHSIVAHHPLVDGNKRLGWIALVTTLAINDVVLDVDDDEGFDLTMRVADGSADVDDITARVHVWMAAQR
ncbi:MAG: type II toxin-antitoxin system death-on-curing family toxin [Actinobacteria bacterium]|nr:type II toxin-antitoxin system death-on-curing family toxin [Actinomycetota bacterium]